MSHASDDRLSRALHVALGLLLAVEGGINLARCLAGDHDPRLIAFSAVQTAGALLFTWSRTVGVGACILVCAFLIAAGVHALDRHDVPFEHLIYAVAVLVVVTHHKAATVRERLAA